MSHFLKELGRKKITAFKDNNIERSNSIRQEQVQAIKDSRIAVVVFSKNYASSRWCLSELLEIVKCEKDLGQLVIPIFYGLDPSHVRKQTGDVGKIFAETCPNITEELKIQWKEALTKFGNTLGYHSAKWDNEAKKIEEITNDVLAKLYSTSTKLGGFEDCVGLEDHIAKMFALLQLESEEVRMVGIWGLSGIGKSVIARGLFQQLSRHFQGSVFIDRVFISKIKEIYHGDNANDYTMKLHLQRNFLSQILGEKDIKVDHLGAVKERLHHQKSLIVIDDLNDQEVLYALVGSSQWFGSGSRIIVVTNNNKHLRAHGISCIYEVGLPSEDLAVKMFCRYAFRQSSPPEGFEKLAVEVVRHAGHLPLGLTVLGSSLRGKDEKYWIIFMRMNQSILDSNIDKILRISYDELSEEDKAIFRHIACLFNLKKANDIMLLLADSNFDFEIRLRNLVAKSLVNVRSNIVDMPPLLQQMGKKIVRKNSDPGKREFLMDAYDIRQVLDNNTGTWKVLGISLSLDEIHDEFYIHKNAFKSMPNLRFLNIFSNRYLHDKKVRLMYLPDSFDYLPPKLKLLRWDGYPMESLPSDFRPENLVMLEMKNSKLKRLWEGPRKLRCLKEMNLWGSENLKDIPDLSMATNLEKLYLSYCLSWVKRPSSLRKFDELTNSDMLEWRNMDTHPTGINLESPKRLILREPTHLCLENLRDGMQPLVRRVKTLPSSLTVLFLWDIPNMVELPFSIQNLNKLTDLKIMRCTNLETLPTGINLESLERLHVNGCPRLTTFPDISTNISSLYLEETAIREVPWWIENFSKLTYLQMESCSKLEYVYINISKLKHLEMVYFSNCGALTGADWNGYLSGLALEGENTSSLLKNNVQKVDFRFINCFNLDQEALLQQLSFDNFILSSEEMPSYFIYQTTGSSFTNVPLLQAPLSPPSFRFRACALVVCEAKPAFGAIGVRMKVTCQFKDRRGDHIDPPDIQKYFSVNQRGSHLLLLDCLFPLSKNNAPLAKVIYEHADIQFHMSSVNSKFKLKRCGIRVHSTDCSSHENRLGNSNTLPQICEANEDGEECTWRQQKR